ncbi:uncharacterized protein LAESUDRAFT_758346 [Laetiporus sulphureus 93-53]|uniref:Uncharacterized protein n=1 Tax=Laetiporus sulphureus 93-53 TaxID=1314785 RepID=A0A165EUG2_9APHY|nr:uncharacterized protein LAESUDRAFT_758346 [Laetiporus sulphureus 93-53]KZT07786.1 hypothetical protein LAESUDRAFT_758346 [Laetiporus sulphureus 93-53]
MKSTLLTARLAGSRNALRATRPALSARNYATPPPNIAPDDDPQLGPDYPHLPPISRQYLPALKRWDDPQMRRNFGDPLYMREEMLSMWGPDIPPVPPLVALRWFTIAALGFVSFGVLTKYVFTLERPAVPREYPYSGLVTELGGLEENKARELTESEDEE